MTTVVLQHPVEQINSFLGLVQAAVGFECDGNDGDAEVSGDVLVAVVLSDCLVRFLMFTRHGSIRVQYVGRNSTTFCLFPTWPAYHGPDCSLQTH